MIEVPLHDIPLTNAVIRSQNQGFDSEAAAEIDSWRQKLLHPGNDSIIHLHETTTGTPKFSEKAIPFNKCDTCAHLCTHNSKGTNLMSRPTTRRQEPLDTFHVDLIEPKPDAYNNHH